MAIRAGAKTTGGDFDSEIAGEVINLLREFELAAEEASGERELPNAVVRTNLPYDHTIILTRDNLWVIGQSTRGVVDEIFADRHELTATIDEILYSARWQFGYGDPFVYSLPSSLLTENPTDRAAKVQALANEWVSSEEQRVSAMSQIITMQPLFGPAAFSVQPKLCFVIMPFADEIAHIYNQIIKPTVESRDLACLRADDIRKNGAIMDHVWKSICEARFLIADLSFGNANVFYELGIAHTVGKETILISRRTPQETKRPFDVLHLRTIFYEDTADGRAQLRTELDKAIREVISPITVS